MNKRTVEFDNAEGDRLHGDLYMPVLAPRAFVLFAHCFTCAADWKAPVKIARALCREGFAVLAFDFTGLGRSDGEFAETNFTTNVSDLLAAAEYLDAAHGAGPAVLVGHSLGGTAALVAAPDIAACRAVVTIGSPSDAAHVGHLLSEARERIESEGEGVVDIGGRPFRIRRQLLEDLERHGSPANLRGLHRALLIMHAPLDTVVPVSEAQTIFEQALHPKSFISLDDADHLLTRERDAEYAAAVLAAWAGRYLDRDAGKQAADGERPVVAGTGSTGFLTEIDAAGHPLVADEPTAAGGTDQGPTPYGLLSAALASCTSMTLQMYARHKRLQLDEAVVEVRHSRLHAEDCENCETRTGRIDRFERKLRLIGDLDAAARQRLLEIADRCPVHRTLEGEILVVTELGDEDA